MDGHGRRLALLALMSAVALLAMGMSAGAAQATCYSSTPNADSVSDADNDGMGAPELLSLDVSLNASCGLTVNPVLNGLSTPTDLEQGDFVEIFIDTDGKPATGDAGADKLVQISGGPGSYYFGPALSTWTGTDYDYADLLTPFGAAGFSASLDKLGVAASPTTLAIDVVTTYDQGTPLDFNDDVHDFVPELIVDPLFLNATFSTTPPVVQPGVPVLPAVTPPAAVQKKASGCTVPNVKRKSVKKAKAALRKAGCKYRIKGKGRVYKQSPKAGTKTDQTVQCKAKKKKKKKRRKAGGSVAAAYG
jgi:PASTA domain-containing protein